MVQLSTSRKYLIWGTHIEAWRSKLKFSEYLNIEGFVDNNVRETTLKGDPIYHSADVLDKPYFFIIVETLENYNEIKKQLMASGKKEFIDFIYYDWIEKKLVYLHGNCHMGILNPMLSSVEEFNEQYAIYPYTAIHNNKDGFVDENILKNIDVFLHQDIQKDNAYGYPFSDEYTLPQLKEDCLRIAIPNLFGLGNIYFPQFYWNERNLHLNVDQNGMFPHGDKFIDRCVENAVDTDEIIRLIEEGSPFTEEEILDNFHMYMNKIRERQNNWDISIYEFILQNYQTHQLFYNQGHPTNIVMAEIARQVLKKLGICGEPDTERTMDNHEEIIYPCVAKTLSLTWKQTELRKSRFAKKINPKMDIREYVKEYIWWNY